MAGIASSGTLAGAVLETAGYLTQEKILATFGQFFQSAGLLIYTIGAVGAVLSVMLFGSYRMARYLLLGPLVLHLLVGVTADTKAVQWKLGGGTPRVPGVGASTTDDSSKAVLGMAQQSLSGTSNLTGKEYRDTIKVSWVFRLFTDLIDRTFNGLIDIILQHENDKNLLFIARNRALEDLLAGEIDDPQLTRMFRGDLLLKCNKMMTSAEMLAAPVFNFRKEQEYRRAITDPERIAEQGMNQEKLQFLLDSRKFWQERYDRHSKTTRVNPSADTWRFMEQTEKDPKSETVRWLKANSIATVAAAAGSSMTCGELWEITKDAILRHAKVFAERLQIAYSAELGDKKKNLLCVEIAQKLGRAVADPDAERCDLVGMAGVFLLRNAITKRNYSQVAQQKKNEMQFLKSIQPGTVVPMDADPDQLELVDGPYDYYSAVDEYNRWIGLYQRKDSPDQFEFHPIVALSQMSGDYETGYYDHQRYQTRGIRQRILTAMLNFPYLQASIVFILTVGWPFMALIVVLAGRAESFLNFFLFWMWVKSWPVLLAFIIVIDQVNFNLFPTYDLGLDDLLGGSQLTEQPLPVILSEAFKVDPTFHTHAYYYLLAFALFSIPPLTGYFFLKGKTVILSSFTEDFLADTNDAKDSAERAYMMGAMNVRLQGMTELEGLAILSQGPAGVGFEGNGRGESSHFWAMASMTGSSLANMAGGTFTNIGPRIVSTRLNQPALYTQSRLDFLRGEVGLDVEWARAFHPLFGRHSPLQQFHEGAQAGIDADLGFELNRHTTWEFVSATAALAGRKLATMSDYFGQEVQARVGLKGGVLTGLLPGMGTLVTWAAARPSFQQVGEFFEKNGQNLSTGDDEFGKKFASFLTSDELRGNARGVIDSFRGHRYLAGADPLTERVFMFGPAQEEGLVVGGPVTSPGRVYRIVNPKIHPGAHGK